MKIGLDARCLEEEKISGVGEYALEIFSNIVKKDAKNEYVLFSNSFRGRSAHLSWAAEHPNIRTKKMRVPNKLINFSIWYLDWPKIDKLIGGAEVFFAPNINFISMSRKCELVATFHDLSFERYPEYFTLKTLLWHYFFVNPRRISRMASRIIAVSDSTAKDLEEIYRTDPGKIKIIRHGVGKEFKPIDRNNPRLLEVQKKYNLPYKFILFLGNIESRKNVQSVIKAHKKLVSENPKLEKYRLVLTGKVSPLCREMIEKEQDNIRLTGYVDRDDKPLIYNLASLFVYPSHFEGFGLPILEAMACGTPVIASNNSSIPEVAGSAAILVDPNRPDEICKAAESILTDEKLRIRLREKGFKQSKKFSWKKSAEETVKYLQKNK